MIVSSVGVARGLREVEEGVLIFCEARCVIVVKGWISRMEDSV